MLKIYVRINAADAVRAGKTTAGELPLTLTDEHLAEWTAEERTVLAEQVREYQGEQRWTGARPVGLAEATPTTLRECVAAEIAARAARATEREAKISAALAAHLETRAAALAAPLDRLLEEGHCWGRRSQRVSDWGLSDLGSALRVRLPHVSVPVVAQGPHASCSSETVDVAVPPATDAERARLAEAEAEVARRNAAVEAEEAAVEARRVEEKAAMTAQEAARRAKEEARAAAAEAARLAWIAARGTPSMRERQAAGCLPADEVWCAIRAEVFAPLGETARFAPLTTRDLWTTEEYPECCHPSADLDIEVDENPHLTTSQFEALKAIRAAASQIPDAQIVARRHDAECGARGCDGTACRFGVLVSVDWYGRPLSREYALPDPTEAEESADDSDD